MDTNSHASKVVSFDRTDLAPMRGFVFAGLPRRLPTASLTGLLLALLIAPELWAAAGERTRQALRESYRYGDVSPAAAAGGGTPAAADIATDAGEPDAVMLPAFEVDALAVPRGLEKAIARAPVAPKKPGKLGTGVIQKDLGKVRMQAVTVLYVPIYIGFSW